MLVLFLKAEAKDSSDESKLPLPERMIMILKEHVRTAKTDEERERARGELRKLTSEES